MAREQYAASEIEFVGVKINPDSPRLLPPPHSALSISLSIGRYHELERTVAKLGESYRIY